MKFPESPKIEKGDILTKGDVIINKIKVGDIHYEFEYNSYIKTEVIEAPVRNDDGVWYWKSKKCNNPDVIINYGQAENPYGHGLNLYTCEVYQGCREL